MNAQKCLDDLGPWPLRVTWLLLPLAGAAVVLSDAFADASRPVQVVTSLGLWGGWAVVLVAALVPSTVSLTIVRLGVPAALAAVVVAAAASGDSPAGWRVVAVCWALVTVGVAFFPATGQAFADGSSYGDERRFPLRVPAPLLLGPVPLTWLAVVAGIVTGPLLLATRSWITGALALAVGSIGVHWGVRALHTLSRRWIVLVPGGVVLHDPLVLGDPVLLRRGNLQAIGPAPADSDALDLTRGALGIALEARLTQPIPITVAATRPGGSTTSTEVTAMLITPTRPGALLTALRNRRLSTPA